METPSPARQIAQLISGYWRSQAIYVAAKLELADQLSAGSLSAGELAKKCGAHAPTLYRLLRALASEGVFHELPERQFANTPLSEVLCKSHPQSQ